jgi:hypothetical protein
VVNINIIRLEVVEDKTRANPSYYLFHCTLGVKVRKTRLQLHCTVTTENKIQMVIWVIVIVRKFQSSISTFLHRIPAMKFNDNILLRQWCNAHLTTRRALQLPTMLKRLIIKWRLVFFLYENMCLLNLLTSTDISFLCAILGLITVLRYPCKKLSVTKL